MLAGLFIILWLAVWSVIPALSQSFRSTLSPPGWVFPNAILDFDFENQQYWMNGRTANVSQAFTVTRATSETCTSLSGQLTYVGSGVPCITDAGLQVYDTATNLALQSQFAATWTATRSTLTANAVASPDLTTNAAALIEDSTATNTHLTTQAFTKAASAIAYTFSVYALTSTRTRIDLQLDDNAGNGAIMVCNLAGQSIGVGTAGVGTAFTSLSTDAYAVGTWTRCILNATSNTATALNATIFLDSGSGTAAKSNSYSGDGASGVPIFGAQLEATTTRGASPYIPTTTTSAARNADNITYSLTNTPIPLEYGMVAKMVPNSGVTNATSQVIVSLDTGSTNDRSQIARATATGLVTSAIIVGGVTNYNQTGGSAMANHATSRVSMTEMPAAQASAANGTLITAGSSATLPATPTVFRIGARADVAANTLCACNILRAAMLKGYIGNGIAAYSLGF